MGRFRTRLGRLAVLALAAQALGLTAPVLAGEALPPPDTESRARRFCTDWLGLSEPQKHGRLLAAEQSEPTDRFDAECRVATRATLRRTLDFECRNWTQLMDFEVRHVVERVLRPCRLERKGLERDNLAG